MANPVSFLDVVDDRSPDGRVADGLWEDAEAEVLGPPARSIRVLIVDDHRSFAEALRLAIDMQPDLECVGIPETAGEAIEMATASCPDVVLMDVRLPDVDGIEATRRLKEVCPDASVLVVTAFSDVELLSRAAGAGASGFLPKESSIADFFDAIRAAGVGSMIVDRATLISIIDRVGASARAERSTASTEVRLTPRELEVLTLMGRGIDARGISKQLGIKLSTCRGYQKSIMFKLGAHSQLEAVVSAVQSGILPPLSP